VIEGWNDIWSGWWAIDRFIIAYGIFIALFFALAWWDTMTPRHSKPKRKAISPSQSKP
jgi:hypothetical protein